MAVRMHSKETMIDTRPGTSTVGIQCSIWEKQPEQRLPSSMGTSIPMNKATEVQFTLEKTAVGLGGEIVHQDDQLVKQSDTSQNSNRGRNDEAQASPSKQQKESSPQNDPRQFPTLDEASYSLMVDVLTGQFRIPVKERTRQQKSAMIQLWRNKGKYTVDDCNPANLYYNGKCVLRKTQLGILVTDN